MALRANVIWHGVPRFLERTIWLLLLPIYTRVLSPAEMGTAMTVLAVASLTQPIIAPGIESAYLRTAYGHRAPENAGGIDPSAIAVIHLTFLTLGLGSLLALAEPISALLLPGIPAWPLYYLAVGSVGLSTLGAPLRAEWLARHRARSIALTQIARIAISVTTTLVALLSFRWGLVSLLLGNFVAVLALLPLYAWTFVPMVLRGSDWAAVRRALPLALVGVPRSLYGLAGC